MTKYLFSLQMSNDCVFICIMSGDHCIVYSCLVGREACTHLVSTCLAMTDVMDSLEIIEIGMQERKNKTAKPEIILISLNRHWSSTFFGGSVLTLYLIRLCKILYELQSLNNAICVLCEKLSMPCTNAHTQYILGIHMKEQFLGLGIGILTFWRLSKVFSKDRMHFFINYV